MADPVADASARTVDRAIPDIPIREGPGKMKLRMIRPPAGRGVGTPSVRRAQQRELVICGELKAILTGVTVVRRAIASVEKDPVTPASGQEAGPQSRESTLVVIAGAGTCRQAQVRRAPGASGMMIDAHAQVGADAPLNRVGRRGVRR